MNLVAGQDLKRGAKGNVAFVMGRRGLGQVYRWQTGEKVTTLPRAVRELIHPGFVLQVGSGLGYPMALLYEIIRQFWGRNPGFTFIIYGGSCTNLVPFLAGGLVKRCWLLTWAIRILFRHQIPHPEVFCRG